MFLIAESILPSATRISFPSHSLVSDGGTVAMKEIKRLLITLIFYFYLI